MVEHLKDCTLVNNGKLKHLYLFDILVLFHAFQTYCWQKEN